MRFDGLAYRTSRFMGVCAVAKPAVGRVFEYLRKIVRHFASLHLNRAEAFDAGRIDQIASVRKRNHFGECRSMNACLVIFGDIFRSELGMRQQFVDNRRFANARVPGQQRNPVADLVRQRVDSFARRSAKFHAIVPDGAIECHQLFYIFKLISIIPVCFIEDEQGRNPVGLGSGKETIDKSRCRLRIMNRDDEQCQVDIRRKDM